MNKPIEDDIAVFLTDIANPEVDRTLLVAWADDEIVHIYMAGGQIHAFYRKRYCPSKLHAGMSLHVDDLMICDHYEVDPSVTDPAFTHLLEGLGVKITFMPADQGRADRALASNAPYYYPIAPVGTRTP